MGKKYHKVISIWINVHVYNYSYSNFPSLLLCTLIYNYTKTLDQMQPDLYPYMNNTWF